MSAIIGTYYNIDKDGGSGGDILTFEAEESYMGRVARQLDDAIVTGDSGDECTIHVIQNGHEFVGLYYEHHNSFLDWGSTEISVLFYSNCKKFSIVLSGQDNADFSIGQVSIQEDGEVTPQVITPDGNGVYEPTGDPGQGNRYMVIILLTTEENLGDTNKEVTVTLTGWSDNGGLYTYSDYMEIEHRARQ